MGEQRVQRAIPREVALEICQQIRQENRGRWFSWNAWWCWGCVRFTVGEPEKLCFHNPPDYRGCAQVNRRYDRQMERAG